MRAERNWAKKVLMKLKIQEPLLETRMPVSTNAVRYWKGNVSYQERQAWAFG